ncbi:hypothetical protein N7466_006335 [Penicillium verhagenii]|uniref:uncharacterized protein n=1 Tax=Penicillium verhagenii TaxID=1562060 RepID=UPI002545ADDE|nr:uncharacterized protein N7466_006335 [Penicillium verhagenii]KAJ5930842.1 hypothetical protein N7466_006335 [Penicillium verhagenii]
MKNYYLATLFLALMGTISADESNACPDTSDCEMLHHGLRLLDRASDFGQCFDGCLDDERSCCNQTCAHPLTCRTNFANCHIKCRDYGVPEHFQCLDTCIIAWNNCKVEPVTDDQLLDHNEHCNRDFLSCRRRCRE